MTEGDRAGANSGPQPDPGTGRLDTAGQLAWLRQAYFGLDGRWYLKLRQRTDAALAQEVDEDVTRSLARLHVRAWKGLAGVTEIVDCRELGRFVRDVFDALYGDHTRAIRFVREEPNMLEWRHVGCRIFEMGAEAGYETAPIPGELPGCGGLRAMAQGWAEAAGGFEAEQRPATGPPRGVACHYLFTLRR